MLAKLILKGVFVIFSISLLVYMLLPGPTSINDFPPLPSSEKSTLEGDTIQVPNVSAYFSNNYRDFVIPFYQESYQKLTPLPFAPLRLNHAPELAFSAIKDQTQSTYLEEMVYPLRESFYVNGMEPLEKDGTPKFKGAIAFEIGEEVFDTKVTLRYYPTKIWARILLWFGISVSIYLLWHLGKSVVSDA